MTEFIVVLCTVPSKEDGLQIAKKLVEDKIAASVSITGAVFSMYRWKGEICTDDEYILIIRSRESLLDRIKEDIISLHPYELPEIISIPIKEGLEPYLNWISENTI